MLRILILGGGFAGLTTAQRLERLTTPQETSITLVSRENFTLFTPMLPEVCSGGIEQRHIVTPLRAALGRTEFVLGEIVAIDLQWRHVVVRHPIEKQLRRIGFDQLVIALGGATSTFGLPGVAERAYGLKTLQDAETLRNQIIGNLELAHVTSDHRRKQRLLTFVIVGGGFTGVEAAGELVDFFHSIRRYYPLVEQGQTRVIVVEGGTSLLPELPSTMGAYTHRNLTARGVDVRLGTAVKEARDDGLVLGDDSVIDSDTIVWSAGVRPAPVVCDLPVQHVKNGAILVGGDFAVSGFPGVWALGDCAAIPKEDGGFYPPTAQHAIREAAVCAHNIAAKLRGKPTKPFAFSSLGSMASLGAKRGVALLPGGKLATGFMAWFLWRTYYLSRLPGWDRKLRVAFDWTAGLIFPRDIAHIRVYTEHAHERTQEDAGLLVSSGVLR
jgi:NADH dehydrogenase